MDIYDVIIIGSGPAGLTAGIYASRANLKTLLIAGNTWGGQLMLTTGVENYPGFAEGILGPQLMDEMRKQALRFGVEWVGKSVTRVDFSKYPFEVGVGEIVHDQKEEILRQPQTSHGLRHTQDDKADLKSLSALSSEKPETKIYLAKSVIVAVGAETKWLGVPGEKELIGRGVSSCAPCDAAFFRDKRVFVVGGGDAAMEEALVLTKFASEVTVVHRRDMFRASKVMADRVLNHEKIKVFWDTEVEEFKGDKSLEKVVLKTKRDRWEKEGEMMLKRGRGNEIQNARAKGQEGGQTEDLKNQNSNVKNGDIKEDISALDGDFVNWEADVDGVFVAIGHAPTTGLFKGQIELDQKGYVMKIQNSKLKSQNFSWLDAGKHIDFEELRVKYPMLTSQEGVFVAGDVHDYHYKQAVTAAAFGCMAAMDLEKWLEERGEIEGMRTQKW